MDFVCDELFDGRRFRFLTVVDIFTRECLAIEVGKSLRGDDVVNALNTILKGRNPSKYFWITEVNLFRKY
jgi:putative transposase